MHMEFDKGMAGVLVVVLSLIASVGLGVITNIDTTTVQKDVDEYVADITGGFTAGKEQSYTDYNTSRNYNGYSNTITNRFAVNFTPSSYVNNYPLTYSEDPTEFSVMSTTATNIPWGSTEYTNGAVNLFGTAVSSYTQGQYNTGNTVKIVKFGDMLPDIMPENTDSLKYIEITLYTNKTQPYYSTHPTNTVAIVSPLYAREVSAYGWWVLPSSFGTSPFIFSNYDGSPYSQATVGGDDVLVAKVRYSVEDNAVAWFRDADMTQLITTAPASDTYVIALADVKDVDAPSGFIDTTSDIIVSYSYENNTQYIDTRYGVGVRNSETVTWSNNQQNGVTSIAFSVWDSATETFNDTGSYSDTGEISYYGTNLTDTFTISRVSGYTYISLNGRANINLGTWDQVQLDIDSITGQLIAYPIDTWNNFNNYSIMNVPTVIGPITKANLEGISWTANNSFRFQVTNTQVFFNSYGVVMIDPSITISDLWPNYTRFAVTIGKVASVGTEIKIGDIRFKIMDNLLYRISVTEGNEEYTPTGLDITDLTIHYVKNDNTWDVNMSSGTNSLDISVPNTYIGMTGTWYFIAGFYNTITKDVTERTWNPSTYNWFESHMFFWMAGFVLLLGLGAYKLGYLDGISILIIIASEFILIIIGGVT